MKENSFVYLMRKESRKIFRCIFSNVQIFLASFKILFPLPSRNKRSNRIPQREKKIGWKMLLVVMAIQHFPDQIAITLVKQARKRSSFSLGETQNENAESPINIGTNGIPNSAASAKCGINVRSISAARF